MVFVGWRCTCLLGLMFGLLGWVIHCGVGFTRLVSFVGLWVLVLPICGLRLAFRLFDLVG